MEADFKTAKKTLRTSNSQLSIVAVNGCCYGKDDNPDKGDYLKLCGQRFSEEYAKVINRFTREFATEYCDEDGSILWEKFVKFNSGKTS